MRRLNLLVLAVVLWPLGRGQAQTARPATVADVIGTWIGGPTDTAGTIREINDTLVIRADSTYSRSWWNRHTFQRLNFQRPDTVAIKPGPYMQPYALVRRDQQLLVLDSWRVREPPIYIYIYAYRRVTAAVPNP